MVLVALALAAACTPGGGAPAASPPAPESPAVADADDGAGGGGGGTLWVGVTQPSGIVPAEASEPADLQVVDAVFDPLTAWAPDGSVRPNAAVRWWSDPTATQWTFRLRPDARFHDGTPVTADDFVFAWELAVAGGEAGYHLRDVAGYEALAAGRADGLEGVTAVDDATLEVRLVRPLADFPAVAAHPTLAPVPRAAWEHDPDGFSRHPVGNGPFAVAEAWGRRDFIRTARFDEWRNDPSPGRVGSRPTPATVGEVVFRVMDPETAYLAFQQRRLDFSPVPETALDAALARYGGADGSTGPGVLLGPRPVLYHFGFNVEQEPFDDPDVRRAVSLALDRSALADEQMAGNLSVARFLVPPGVAGTRPAPCHTCVHQPTTARRLFAQAGVDELTLWISRGGGHERVAGRLRRDLATVGVRLRVQSLDFADYREALRSGEAGFYRLGWALDYPTMDNALYPLFHSSSRPDRGGHNYAGLADPALDALLDEARATLDDDARRALYQDAEDLLLDRQVIAPVLAYHHQVVVSDRVRGLGVGPLGTLSVADAEIVEPGAAD